VCRSPGPHKVKTPGVVWGGNSHPARTSRRPSPRTASSALQRVSRRSLGGRRGSPPGKGVTPWWNTRRARLNRLSRHKGSGHSGPPWRARKPTEVKHLSRWCENQSTEKPGVVASETGVAASRAGPRRGRRARTFPCHRGSEREGRSLRGYASTLTSVDGNEVRAIRRTFARKRGEGWTHGSAQRWRGCKTLRSVGPKVLYGISWCRDSSRGTGPGHGRIRRRADEPVEGAETPERVGRPVVPRDRVGVVRRTKDGVHEERTTLSESVRPSVIDSEQVPRGKGIPVVEQGRTMARNSSADRLCPRFAVDGYLLYNGCASCG